jgi:Ca2+-binding RTX toxin-like protein
LEDRRLLFAPGDIAVTNFSADGPDHFAFVALEDIAAGSVMQITDNEWNGTTFNDLNEGVLTWTSPGSIIAAGTIVSLTSFENGSRAASHGTLAGSGSTNFAGGGDEFYFVEGTVSVAAAPTTFVTAFGHNGRLDLTNTGLTLGSSAFEPGTGTPDGGVYTGPRSGEATLDDYRALIGDFTNNWSLTNDGDSVNIDSDPFSASGGGPTPFADKVVWDPDNGTADIQDGVGTWSTSSHAAPNTNWNDDTGNVAFAGTLDAEFGDGDNGAPLGAQTVTLDDDGGNAPIVAPNLIFAASDSTYTLTGADLDINGDITANESAEIQSDLNLSGNGTINVGPDQALTLSGELAGDISIASGGNGRVVINNANAGYSGVLSIDNDDVILEVAAGASTGSGNVENTTFGGGAAKFTGDGTIGGTFLSTDFGNDISGNLTFASNATILGGGLNPGAAETGTDGNPGLLTFSADVWFDGAGGTPAETTYQWDLLANADDSNGTAGTDFDQIAISGDLNDGPDSDGLVIQIELHGSADIGDAFFSTARSWTVLSSGFNGFNDAQITLELGSNGNGGGGLGDWSAAVDANGEITITHTPVVVTPPPTGVFLNELMISTPGTDSPNEYVEIRGPVGQSLDDVFLVFVESDSGGSIGEIQTGGDEITDLSGTSIGANGFLVILNDANDPYTVNAGATVVDVAGFDIENPSFTALLIHDNGTGGAPVGGQAIDADGDGELNLPSGWTVLDSIGILDGGGGDKAFAPFGFAEDGNGSIELNGELVTINYGADNASHVMRIGNSIGSTSADWVALNTSGTAPAWVVDESSDAAFVAGITLEDQIGEANPASRNNNDAPIAVDEAYNAIEDVDLVVDAASGVLANDTDADGDALTASIVANATSGTVTLNTDGSFNYSPNANFSGSDSFTYVANDGQDDSNTASVSITVAAVADAPTVTTSDATGNENSNVALSLNAALVDADGSESLAIQLSGVPATVTVSPATELGNGDWSIALGDLANVVVFSTDNVDPFTATLTATATEASNSDTAIGSTTLEVTIQNVVPSAAISGVVETVPNIVNTFDFNIADISPDDDAAGFSYVINWGDGTPEETFGPGAASPLALDHAFPDFGQFDIAITATDKDGGEGAANLLVNVVPVAMVGNDLHVGGTDRVNDRIIVLQAGLNSVFVRYNGTRYGEFELSPTAFVSIFGGDGNDRLTMSNVCVNSEIHAEEGADYVAGGRCNDIIFGGSGRDILLGGEGDNVIDGGADNDRITSRSGDDIITGGAGNDYVSAGQGNDFIHGNEGNDKLSGQGGSDLIHGDLGNDVLIGGSGQDVLFGGFGNDTVRGNNGDDLLIGGSGADKMIGEGGEDILNGGEAASESDDALLLLLWTDWNNSRDDTNAGSYTDDDTRDALSGGGSADTIYIGPNDRVVGLRPGDNLLSF